MPEPKSVSLQRRGVKIPEAVFAGLYICHVIYDERTKDETELTS